MRITVIAVLLRERNRISNNTIINTTHNIVYANKSAGDGGFDWSGTCNSVQVILVQPCSQLVNSDGSLSSDGQHAMDCIKNGALLALGGQVLSIPLPEAIKILTTIAPSFGCGSVVDFHGAGQLSNLGILQTIINTLG